MNIINLTHIGLKKTVVVERTHHLLILGHTQGASQEGCEYGCISFITVPHGSKPVSSGKGTHQ